MLELSHIQTNVF